MAQPTARQRTAIARAVRYKDRIGEAKARQDYAAIKIELAIQEAVAKAPPLRREQLDRLVAILRGTGVR